MGTWLSSVLFSMASERTLPPPSASSFDAGLPLSLSLVPCIISSYFLVLQEKAFGAPVFLLISHLKKHVQSHGLLLRQHPNLNRKLWLVSQAPVLNFLLNRLAAYVSFQAQNLYKWTSSNLPGAACPSQWHLLSLRPSLFSQPLEPSSFLLSFLDRTVAVFCWWFLSFFSFLPYFLS